jgi:FkbM family methyltransferase
VRDWIRKFLARNRRHWLVGKIGRNLGYYHQGFENQDYDQATNGEKFVLESLAKVYPAATIFDVGAHYGEWAKMAFTAVPEGRIHAFEVIPATGEKLKQACTLLKNVTVHQVGLGEQDGVLEFSVAKGRDDLSSGLAGLHGGFHKFEFETIRCPVLTGDRLCAELGVERIDFLKLDVEGLEPRVLKGFTRMLAERRIRMIQFEYGQINLKARFFLGDFHELLGAHGMKLGRIFPNHVDFQEYSFARDNLSGPNFLAVEQREQDLLRVLGG